MNFLVLYIICWILIVLIVVALSLVIIYGRMIDNCRTSQTLYCYAGDNGYRCDTASEVGGVTLQEQLANINTACNPIDCITLGDPIPSTPGSTKYTVLPFDTGFECGTEPGFSCDPNVDLPSYDLLNFPNDPLIPTGGEITGEDLMTWFCNPNQPATASKITVLNSFTASHPDAYVCKPLVFKGQVNT